MDLEGEEGGGVGEGGGGGGGEEGGRINTELLILQNYQDFVRV